jgi:hypothetical protein
VICPKCGSRVRKGGKFCPRCTFDLVRFNTANRFRVVFLIHYCPMCGKKLTGGGPCPTCGAQTKALIPPPVLLPPRNRISRAGALILLVFVGAYIELGLLVGQGFVEPPTTQLMYVSSLIFPLIVLIAILWAILSLE